MPSLRYANWRTLAVCCRLCFQRLRRNASPTQRYRFSFLPLNSRIFPFSRSASRKLSPAQYIIPAVLEISSRKFLTVHLPNGFLTGDFYLLGLMLQQAWITPLDEPLLDEIEETLGVLDSGNIDDKMCWDRLFGLVDELRHQEDKDKIC